MDDKPAREDAPEIRTRYTTPYQQGEDPVAWLRCEIPTWKVYEDKTQQLRALSPTYGEDGIVILAIHPEELVERVRALERVIALAFGRMGRLPVGRKVAGEAIPVWDPVQNVVRLYALTAPEGSGSPPPLPSPPPPAPRPQRADNASPSVDVSPLSPLSPIEVARAKGYTGDPCPQCQSLQMKRVGSCLCCDSCGATTGCG